jgi:hypothetical protein
VEVELLVDLDDLFDGRRKLNLAGRNGASGRIQVDDRTGTGFTASTAEGAQHSYFLPNYFFWRNLTSALKTFEVFGARRFVRTATAFTLRSVETLPYFLTALVSARRRVVAFLAGD